MSVLDTSVVVGPKPYTLKFLVVVAVVAEEGEDEEW